jgi:hypothetical protein
MLVQRWSEWGQSSAVPGPDTQQVALNHRLGELVQIYYSHPRKGGRRVVWESPVKTCRDD